MLSRCLFALVFPGALAAQRADSLPSAGSIRGTVVDAASALPLGGATVTIGPSDASGAFPPQRGSYQLAAARTTVTKDSGVYVFSDLSTGRYRLYVQRIGYEPAAVDVELRGSAAPDLSVGLVVVPVRLRAVRVQSTFDNPFGRATTGGPPEGEARVAAARQRQQQFLGTDVRELTYSDVVEAATMGETDLFRALRRLPGVGGNEDYSTELWIRGATWNETRVTFDGLPLIEPTHATETLAGVGTDAVGTVFLHPGVRPVSLSGDGAALVDLRSRPGGGDGAIRTTAEITQVGGHLAFDQRDPGGRYDWTVAARRNFQDLLPSSRLLVEHFMWLDGGLSHGKDEHYTEVATRGDVSLGAGRALETSALFTNNYMQSIDGPDGKFSPGGSGNAIVKSALRLPVAGLVTEHSVGLSHFGSRALYFRLVPLDTFVHSTSSRAFDVEVASVDYFTIAGEVRPPPARGQSWSAGYAWTLERTDSRTPGFVWSARDLSDQPRVGHDRLEHATAWGERRWQLGSRLVADGGVRVDAGGHIRNTGDVRPTPTLQLRYDIGGSTFISAGAGRSFQYTQEIGGCPCIPLLASRETPAIVADQANLGVEDWRTGGILLSANAYARRLGGIVMRVSPEDELAAPEIFTSTTVRSYGAEFGLRKLTGRVTGAIDYSYNRATGDDGKRRFTALGERRHSLDATAMTRLGGLRLGGALTVTSGAPYTRTLPGVLAYDSTKRVVFWQVDPVAGPRNAQRLPMFESVDLLADWTFHVWRASFTTFVQVQNALDRLNFAWNFADLCAPGSKANVHHPGWQCAGPDALISPVARLTSGGLRVAF